MPDSYELVLHNRSAQPDLAFIVYAVPPVNSGVSAAARQFAPRGGYPVAWQEQGVNPGATARFQWTASYALMCARQPCRIGDSWESGATWQVRGAGGVYLFDYTNGDYFFSDLASSDDPPPSGVTVHTSENIPIHGAQGPSIALAISTGTPPAMMPVIATDSGRNLTHRISLPPVYRIWAGQDTPGALLDPDLVRGHREVQFTRASTSGPLHAEWTLDPTNHWRPGNIE